MTKAATYILFIISGLMFWQLSQNYLANWDEAWYADISRNLVYQPGLGLIWNGQAFFDKPPLYLWLSAVVMKIFGFSEWTARAVSAASAIGTCWIVYLLTAKLFSKNAGLLALIIIGSSIGFLYRARTGNIDTLLAFWMVAIAWSYFGKRFVLMGIALGLGYLTKGLAVVILPLCFLPWAFNKPKWWLGVAIGVGVSLIWLVASYLTLGQVFIEQFFANQTGKIIESAHPFGYWSGEYLNYLRSGLKLWWLVFIPATTIYFWKFFRTDKIAIVIYVSISIIILSLAREKSNWFLVPIYPFMAIIIAGAVHSLLQQTKEKIWTLVIIVFSLLAVLQLYRFQSEYITADSSVAEAEVAVAASKLVPAGQPIYLTDSFYPTAVYYTQRPVYAVFGNVARDDTWWILPKSDWQSLVQKDPLFVIASPDDQSSLERQFPGLKFETLYQSGERRLIYAGNKN